MTQALDRHEPPERAPVSEDHLKSADQIARFTDAKNPCVQYRPRVFEELRCPICGHFGCWGC